MHQKKNALLFLLFHVKTTQVLHFVGKKGATIFRHKEFHTKKKTLCCRRLNLTTTQNEMRVWVDCTLFHCNSRYVCYSHWVFEGNVFYIISTLVNFCVIHKAAKSLWFNTAHSMGGGCVYYVLTTSFDCIIWFFGMVSSSLALKLLFPS